MKERLDILLVKRKMIESRTKAKWLIKHGFVFVKEKKIIKPGKKVNNSLEIQLKKKFPYVGKGGIKLEKALSSFSILVRNKVCVDIGASVGGFTECLIKHGANKVYAIDTASNLLHSSLRSEKMKEKVVPMLGIDARNSIMLSEKIDICTIDVTFTSLKKILPNAKKFLKNRGEIVALVKPIFETEFHNDTRFKIIRDPSQLYQILNSLILWCVENQLYPYGIIKSHLLGKEGSIEFFIHLKPKKNNILDFSKKIKSILEEIK